MLKICLLGKEIYVVRYSAAELELAQRQGEKKLGQ